MTSLRVSSRADCVELLLATGRGRQINHSVGMRASDLQRRLGVRYHISFNSLGPAWGVAGVQWGVAGGSLKNARGRVVWGCESMLPTVSDPLFELFSAKWDWFQGLFTFGWKQMFHTDPCGLVSTSRDLHQTRLVFRRPLVFVKTRQKQKRNVKVPVSIPKDAKFIFFVLPIIPKRWAAGVFPRTKTHSLWLSICECKDIFTFSETRSEEYAQQLGLVSIKRHYCTSTGMFR